MMTAKRADSSEQRLPREEGPTLAETAREAIRFRRLLESSDRYRATPPGLIRPITRKLVWNISKDVSER